MSKENTKTVLEEAVLEMKSILEAADKNAKDKIAKELPSKFEELLSEEIKKLKNNKKESVHESAKGDKKEPQNEGKKEDTDDNKESLNEMDEVDMREMSIEEVEEAFDSAVEDDIFETIDVEDIASEIDEMEGLQEEIDDMQQETENHNDPYSKLKSLYEMMTDMMSEMDEAKMHEEMHEAWDSHMKEMYGESYTESIGEEKCNELYEMYKKSQSHDKKGDVNESEEMNNNPQLQQNAPQGDQKGNPVIDKLKQFGTTLLKGLEQAGGAAMSQPNSFMKEEDINEQHNIDQMLQQVAQIKDKNKAIQFLKKFMGYLEVAGAAIGNAKGGTIGENEGQVDPQIDALAKQTADAAKADPTVGQKVMNALKALYAGLEKAGAAAGSGIKGGSTSITEEGDLEVMDEVLTNTHAAQRKVQGGHSPNLDVAGKHREDRTRPAMREGDEKKLKALIEENKKLMKQISESKKQSSDLKKTNETYKGVLEKYRNQLQEMAVLNTNIAHVNNLLIKENNLSIDEKKAIVNKFKDVETISEADEVYKSLLSEMVEVKKEKLDEGIEEKLNDSIDASSSKIVTEQVVEKTAFKNAHLDKIKSIMNYDLKR